MNTGKIHPVMSQYLSIKGQYPDAILFFRMGDFYEMFFEDAEVAARALDITLTSRNKKDETPIPMCGVPFRTARTYIGRLLDKGFKVAVCDQMEDPAASKGLVRRDVVRVITPGMVLEDELLDERSDNFVLAAARAGDLLGLSHMDISTALFRVTESADPEAVREEALRIAPRELLLPEGWPSDPLLSGLAALFDEKIVTAIDEQAFFPARAREGLLEQFRTLTLEGFGCEGMKAGTAAAGALLHYVRRSQLQPVDHLTRIESYSLENYLGMDAVSCRNLEILENIRGGSRRGSLLEVLDRTKTSMGGRLLKQWLRQPLLDTFAINERLDAVDEAKGCRGARTSLREALASVSDLERLSGRILMGHGNARDLLAVKRSVQSLPAIRDSLSNLKAALFAFPEGLGPLEALASRIEAAVREDAPLGVREGGMIRAGYHPELDELASLSREGKGWLAELETREREATGIATLKVRYNKVFGYYLEVPKARAGDVPARYVRRQTLVNAERYITEDLKNFELKVLNAEERRAALEYDLFREICGEVGRNGESLRAFARFLARLDCLTALAEAADANHYSRPEVTDSEAIAIEDGRHPVVEKMIAGERFVPNSIRLDNDSRQVLIITGPNMAGKSTLLRQVALMVVMAQAGSFVPARAAEIGVVDRIFTRVGALDNLSGGQSTFLVEMEETANILNNATGRSLIVMDEIGRGTSTFDGLSIAWAVAEHLHGLRGTGVKTLFATHYHELTELASVRPRVKNFHVAVKEWNDQIIFLRKLVEGGTNRSYGIQVARLAGIPEAVVERAKKVLSRIENHGGLPAPPAETAEDRAPRQLPLFSRPAEALIERLKKMDISRMTPLDALNVLDELSSKARSLPE